MYRRGGDGHVDFHLTDRKMYTYICDAFVPVIS